MDNCKTIQELILTDYLDGQIDSSTKISIENHFLSCSSCKDFAKEAKEHLVKPFQQALIKEVPSSIWIGIRGEIDNQQYAKSGVIDRVKEWLNTLTLPKLVPSLVSFVMIVFVSSTVYFNQQIKQSKDQETGAYVAYVLTSESGINPMESADFDTPIEKYFL